MRQRLGCVCYLMAAVSLVSAAPKSRTTGPGGRYIATAYSARGTTAAGMDAHQHVIAADPTVLPIGSRIKLKEAGKYSGEYVVADTGEKIVGRKLDIFVPSTRECRKFGKKRVRVQVIQLGDGTQQAAKDADQVVKQDVNKDVQKGVVGNAATEVDSNKKGVATTPAAAAPAAPPKHG